MAAPTEADPNESPRSEPGDRAAAVGGAPPAALLRKLELLAVLVVLLVGLLPRARDVGAPFDREFDGFQGATFALFAVNFERVGFGPTGGYPVYNLDLPEPDPVTGATDPREYYAYANHSPLLAWLTWGSMKLLGPEGWEQAWREGRAPPDIELSARLPFLLLHLFGLWAFWWMLRQGLGAVQCLIGLTLLSVMPISVLYAGLINYETPSIPFVLVAYGCYVRWVRYGGLRPLVGVALGFALASSFTYAPLFFVPPLCLDALLRRGLRGALRAGAAATLGVLPPLVLQGLFASRALERMQQETTPLLGRAKNLLRPLLDGTGPPSEWVARQVERVFTYGSVTIATAAVLGLAIVAWRLVRLRRTAARADEVDVALPLLSGAYLMLFCYYQHTFDEPPQTTFLLNPTPALAALAAVPLAALAPLLARLRGGIAPLVVVVSLVALPAIARTGELRRDWRAPGPNDAAPGDSSPGGEEPQALGPPLQLPVNAGPELAEVLPAGAVGLYPAALGFNFATFWYAWRTMIPISSDLLVSVGAAVQRIEDTGRGAAPRYFLLPVTPPDYARDEVAALERAFAEALPTYAERGPDVETEHWRAWRLRTDD